MYVQILPTEQATSALTDFFSRGHDPFAHACKARPPTIVGRTSLSVSLSLSFADFAENTVIWRLLSFVMLLASQRVGGDN